MRAWILLSLVACSEPVRRPPQTTTGPRALNGCQSSGTALGGVRYTCGAFHLYDNTDIASASIHTFEAALVASARAEGIESTRRVIDVPGAEDAVLIEYRQAEGRAFDVVAMQPMEAKARFVQCHMSWFTDTSSQSTREQSCARIIGNLLQRPAPTGREVSVDCRRAAVRIATLPGGPTSSADLNAAQADFATRCTDKAAACALEAKNFGRAMFCLE